MMGTSGLGSWIRENPERGRNSLNSHEFSYAVSRWLLGLVLSAGGGAIWVGIVTMLVGWAMTWWSVPPISEQREVTVNADGEPVVRITRYRTQAGVMSVSSQSYESLDGEPLSLTSAEQYGPELSSWSVQHFDGGSRNPLWRRVPFLPARYPYWTSREIPEPLPWAARLQSFYVQSPQRQTTAIWYFVWPERRAGTGYFVGYDTKSKTRLGYLGTEGFSVTMLPVSQQFPAWNQAADQVAHLVTETSERNRNSNSALPVHAVDAPVDVGVYFITPDRDRAYRINFTQRTVQLVRSDLKSPIEFLSVRQLWNNQGYVTDVKRLLRFADRLEFVDHNLQPKQVISLPEELRDLSFSLAAMKSGGFFVLPVVSSPGRRISQVEQPLLWLDEQGQVTQRRSSSLPMRFWGTSALGGQEMVLPLSLIPANGLTILSLAPFVPMFDDSFEYLRKPGEPLTWSSAMKSIELQSRRLGWSLYFCVLSGVPFTVACWWRQRRFAASRLERLAWPALVYFFGLAGWIAFVSHREWPRRRVGR